MKVAVATPPISSEIDRYIAIAYVLDFLTSLPLYRDEKIECVEFKALSYMQNSSSAHVMGLGRSFRSQKHLFASMWLMRGWGYAYTCTNCT